MQTVQLNDVGVAVKGPVVEDGSTVDVSAVTTKQLIFKKPNGVTVTKSASFITTGSDGQIQYITQAGDLDVAGQWEVQAIIGFPGSFAGRSRKGKFEVLDNI